jgi:hypothetical protein
LLYIIGEIALPKPILKVFKFELKVDTAEPLFY